MQLGCKTLRRTGTGTRSKPFWGPSRAAELHVGPGPETIPSGGQTWLQIGWQNPACDRDQEQTPPGSKRVQAGVQNSTWNQEREQTLPDQTRV